jgi:hypothetical protein
VKKFFILHITPGIVAREMQQLIDGKFNFLLHEEDLPYRLKVFLNITLTHLEKKHIANEEATAETIQIDGQTPVVSIPIQDRTFNRVRITYTEDPIRFTVQTANDETVIETATVNITQNNMINQTEFQTAIETIATPASVSLGKRGNALMALLLHRCERLLVNTASCT